MKRLRSSNKNSNKITSRVVFHPQPMIHCSLHIHDYTDEEIKQTWYSKKELKEMKLQCRKLLEEEEDPDSIEEIDNDDDDNDGTGDHTITTKKISTSSSRLLSLIDSKDEDDGNNNNNNGKENNSPNSMKSNDCFRGLEGKTTEGLIKKRMVKAHARDAVFQEQDRQWELGTTNPEKIAHIYRKSTEVARTSARLLGLRDAKESKALLASQQRRVGLSPLGAGCSPFTFSNPFFFAAKWQGYDKQTRTTPP
jgi:hypothetical protein